MSQTHFASIFRIYSLIETSIYDNIRLLPFPCLRTWIERNYRANVNTNIIKGVTSICCASIYEYTVYIYLCIYRHFLYTCASIYAKLSIPLTSAELSCWFFFSWRLNIRNTWNSPGTRFDWGDFIRTYRTSTYTLFCLDYWWRLVETTWGLGDLPPFWVVDMLLLPFRTMAWNDWWILVTLMPWARHVLLTPSLRGPHDQRALKFNI